MPDALHTWLPLDYPLLCPFSCPKTARVTQKCHEAFLYRGEPDSIIARPGV